MFHVGKNSYERRWGPGGPERRSQSNSGVSPGHVHTREAAREEAREQHDNQEKHWSRKRREEFREQRSRDSMRLALALVHLKGMVSLKCWGGKSPGVKAAG